MRILLVNVVDARNGIESLFVPLGLGYLAAYLRRERPHVEVAICGENVGERIESWQPDVVGLSSVTQNFEAAREHARIARAAGCRVIVGGVHITMLPGSLAPEMDVGVMGEGEEALVELLDLMERDALTPESLAAVRGIVYRDAGGELNVTEARPPIKPLDGLPLPARDLLGVETGGRAHLFSSRGCPYRCVFCASSRFWPGVRSFTPEYVLRELREVLETYRPSQITFYDDLFIFDRRRLAAIVEGIEAERMQERVEFAVSVRANLVDEEVAGLLKRMNVVGVSMGLESGSAATLASLKPSVTLEENERAVALLDGMGFQVNGSFVIGSPRESRADVLQTLRFIERHPMNIANTYILTPYPGTPVWDDALARGLVSEDMAWSRLALGVESADGFVHVSEVLDREELFALYRRFLSAAKRKWPRKTWSACAARSSRPLARSARSPCRCSRCA